MSIFLDTREKNEWDDLGIYYDFDEEKKCWKFYGTKIGFASFCNKLGQYVENKSNDFISEHEHYGPDLYLKIVTWHEAVINADGIYGTINDLKSFITLLKSLVENESKSEIIIDKNYSDKNVCSIVVIIKEDDFLPSQMFIRN